jgi:LmbE family N-acetylglucosaminyl deacetylase
MEVREIGEGFGSIMVLVPHEDDEILMCAGIMENAVRYGVKLTVVIATNGDYGSKDGAEGRVRLRESLEGLKFLGVPEDQVVFLGYADTGMPEEESFLFGLYHEEDGEKIHPSHCGISTYGLPEKEEFHKENYGEHGLYTRNGFRGDLKALLMEYRPAHIFTTAAEDTHGDHSGLFFFVREVLGECKEEGYEPKLYSGIVHSRAGDENWPRRGEGIIAFDSPELYAEGETLKNGTEEEDNRILGDLKWEDRIVFLVPDSMRGKCLEENRKARALAKHVTALKPDAVDFLYAFVKEEEIFWEI